jgi:chitodextrinase
MANDCARWLTLAMAALLVLAACNEPPRVSLDGPTSSDEGDSVTLVANVVDDQPSGHSLSWDLGDGTKLAGMGKTITHVYGKHGRYDVGVVVTDPKGAQGSARTSITIRNLPPKVSGCKPLTGREGHDVEFDASATDPGSDSPKLEWDFGDGAHARGGSVTHRYDRAGKFTATFTATDDVGASSSCTANVVVRLFGFHGDKSHMVNFFQQAAEAAQGCFHWSGNFVEVVEVKDAFVSRESAWVKGEYAFRLAATGDDVYRESVRFELRYNENETVSVRVASTACTAPTPCDPECPLREWTNTDDADAAVSAYRMRKAVSFGKKVIDGGKKVLDYFNKKDE